jgi:hypothetical protein
LDIKWTWDNLKNKYPLSWTIMPMDIILDFRLQLDKEAAGFDSWNRAESGTPLLVTKGNKAGLDFTLKAAAAKGGVVMKLESLNNDQKSHSLRGILTHMNGWMISNQGWIDGVNSHILLTQNQGRADRIITVAKGADHYPVVRDGKAAAAGVPMSDSSYDLKDGNSMKSLISVFEIPPGTAKAGYWFLPYNSYFEEAEKLYASDWDALLREAEKEYIDLLSQCMEFNIPDQGVIHCFNSCLADLFAMREEMADGYTGVSAGTELYRSPNSGEGVFACHVFDQLGYPEEAKSDMRVYLEGQDESGCWASSKGWEHDGWAVCYWKSMLAMEHYKLTRDMEFLEKIYPRMKASSLFNHQARQKSKNEKDSPFFGLMPRGMGDGGLMNGSDYYGVFYPSNCLTVAADGLTLEVAEILGFHADIPALREIYTSARNDLVTSLRKNAAYDNGVPYIPGIAGIPDISLSECSLYGCLWGFYPARLLEQDDPLIKGTINIVESKQISEGGLPVGTGWMKDGLWVAMALDNFASAYLRMNEYDKASKYFYPVLNHASPLVTWCEERGVEKGSPKTSGDLQHCWTPVSVCGFLREMMIYEDKDLLHIAAATPREWLETGLEIGVKRAYTHFGLIDYSIKRIGKNQVEINLSSAKERNTGTIFHIRLPKDKYTLKLESCTIPGAVIHGETVTVPGSSQKKIALVLSC